MSTEQEDTRITPEEHLSAGGSSRDPSRDPSRNAPPDSSPDPSRRAASPDAGRDGDASDESLSDAAADSGTVALPDDYLEVKARAEERDRFLDELKRARANLENLQKRTRRERLGLEKKGARRVLTDLLEVVDNFERALASLDSESAIGSRGGSGLEDGVRMIHQQLEEVLQNQGVTEIVALGEPFNPEYHEAVTQEEVEDRPTGEVVKVLQRGYLHHDAVLRPTAVKVALNVADRRTSPEEDRSQGDDLPSDDLPDAATERPSDADE